jgi:hypothetical protein
MELCRVASISVDLGRVASSSRFRAKKQIVFLFVIENLGFPLHV